MKIKPKVKKYGKGGSIKDDIININGDYYNNDIIDGLDRDARVLNNQENKFLNRYGVTDRNSFYNKFPTEEIFNFKNGSDKARHYGLSTPYVDETTITLKNGGSIKKYPNGGRQPIVVNNENDPRLQAYNDSLLTFSNVQRFNKNVKEYYDKNIGNKAIDHHDALASNINPLNRTPITPIDEARLMRDKFNEHKNQIISSVKNSPYEPDVEYKERYIHTPSRYLGDSFADRVNPSMYINDFWFEVPLYSFPKPVQPITLKPSATTTVGDVVGDKIAKSKDNVAVLNSKLIPKNRLKEPTLELNQEQQYLPQKEQHLEFDPIGLKKGTYFTRPRQQQEAGQGKMDYFDSKTGKLLKTMEFGGKSPKYEWSKGIDNIQPITQTQNNSSITTGNKKLSTEELKKAAEYTKKYNQQHLEEEYNNRQNKLKQSIDAQKQPLSLKNLQTQTQSTGDKFSLAMNSKYGNPKDYPTLSGYMQGLDYINPAKMIGDMTSGLGSVPQDVNEGNYLKAGLSVGTPLFAGAMAGIGTQGIKPFVNNLVNPLAGTGEVINNLGNKYLPNASKLNSNAFKPNPNKFYRQVDTPTFNEGLESGLIRGKQDIGYSDESAMKMFGDDAYYNKGRLYYKNEKDYPYLFEANLPEDRFIPKVNGRTRKYTTENTRVRVSKEPLPINDPNITIYKKDWWKGYKEVPRPKSNFKSEINWGKWNKEIPDNPQLMKEYNAIDYRKNPLSDKEKEMYQWFDEQMRFDKLPQTTNKQSIEVLDNFKQRIRTPEGQKRLKELGITEEQLLQDLKIVEDTNTYGYYRGLDKNTIAMNPNHPLPKKVVRHEIEHGVQNALRESKINKAIDGTPAEKLKALESTTTEIDDILSELTLRREGTPNKVWNKINTNETVNINNYKSLISNKQNATDYFLTGSDGAEKSAFLGEVQQYMMDTGVIPKNSYTHISPEMVQDTFVNAMFDEKTGGKYLRLFNIIKADPNNYKIISKGLNKMLSITPLIGAGAYMRNKEYKNGGEIGDNGMFDMTNPNIYKALVPGVIGLGAASQIDEKQNGGSIKKYPNGGDLKNAYSITADALSLFPPTSGLGYVMGLPTTAYDMYEDYQKGDIKQMGLDAMGLIPAFKLMKYSKFAKSATQGINMAFKFNKAVDVANMANDVNQTIEKKEFGGNITRESEWELVNETNKKLPKRRLNLNKSSDWEIVD